MEANLPETHYSCFDLDSSNLRGPRVVAGCHVPIGRNEDGRRREASIFDKVSGGSRMVLEMLGSTTATSEGLTYTSLVLHSLFLNLYRRSPQRIQNVSLLPHAQASH